MHKNALQMTQKVVFTLLSFYIPLSYALPSSQTTDAATENSALIYYENWINDLSSHGYKVVQGNAFLLENSDCELLISIFNSCFGQNPAAPYIIPQPPTEGSYVDPYYAQALIEPGPDGQPTDIIYRLSDKDALVTVVSYPPKAAYFGYQSYVFTSKSSNYHDNPPKFPVVSPNPDRYEIFGSIGNDINNVIVQEQIGRPWGGSVVIYITTSNQEIAEHLIAQAKENNIDPNSIFIEPIGSNVITGNTRVADDMMTLIRYAIPKSTTDGDDWIDALSSNVLVYKISNNHLDVDRYGKNQYTPRKGTHTEKTLTQSLELLAALLQTYLTEVQYPEPIAVKKTRPTSRDNAFGIPHGLVGADCIAKGSLCAGDNQDTSTYAVRNLETLGETETAFVVGVNHNLFDNASYISVDVYNAANATGVANSSQTNPDAVGFESGVLTGSAQAVLKALDIQAPASLRPILPYLYVTFISRNCDNPDIVAAQEYCIDLMGDSLIPADGSIAIAERSYIQPGTTTGGNVNVMLYPRIVASEQDFK